MVHIYKHPMWPSEGYVFFNCQVQSSSFTQKIKFANFASIFGWWFNIWKGHVELFHYEIRLVHFSRELPLELCVYINIYTSIYIFINTHVKAAYKIRILASSWWTFYTVIISACTCASSDTNAVTATSFWTFTRWYFPLVIQPVPKPVSVYLITDIFGPILIIFDFMWFSLPTWHCLCLAWCRTSEDF